MANLGLTFLLETDDMCSVLTTVNQPPGIDIDLLRHSLREQSIIVYEGKGPLKGRVFQVGSIGELSKADVKQFLRALRGALTGMQEVEPPNMNLPPRLSPDPFRVVPVTSPAGRHSPA